MENFAFLITKDFCRNSTHPRVAEKSKVCLEEQERQREKLAGKMHSAAGFVEAFVKQVLRIVLDNTRTFGVSCR